MRKFGTKNLVSDFLFTLIAYLETFAQTTVPNSDSRDITQVLNIKISGGTIYFPMYT
jgi:hypothetical protein